MSSDLALVLILALFLVILGLVAYWQRVRILQVIVSIRARGKVAPPPTPSTSEIPAHRLAANLPAGQGSGTSGGEAPFTILSQLGDTYTDLALVGTHVEGSENEGQFARRIHMRSIAHYEDGSLVRDVNDWGDGDTNFPNVVSHSSLMVYTAPDGKRRICPTNDPSKYIEVGSLYIKPSTTWNKVSLNGFQRSGNVLTSTNTNVDIRITHAGHYCKLDAQLKNGYTPPNGQVAFPVSLNGLTWNAGKILDNGIVVASLRAPEVYDNANQLNRKPITWDFRNISGQTYLLLTLPSLTGMSQPVIDPTIVLQPAAADGIDTYLLSASPDNNYGTQNNIDLYGNSKIGLIKFDLTGLVGANTTDRTLTFANAYASAAGNNNLNRILAANNAWTEAGAKWNYATGTTRWAGDAGGDGGADAGCSQSGTDYSATLLGNGTNATASGAATSFSLGKVEFELMVNSNSGMRIIHTTGGDWYPASSDHATAAYRPTLTVTYTLPHGRRWLISKSFRTFGNPLGM